MSQAADDLGRRAVRAAAEVAEAHGVRVRAPVVLKDGFNAVVWMRPAPVVARVVLVPAVLRSNVDELIERELAVTDYLCGLGVAAARRSPDLPAGPHRRDGLWMSFWQRLDIDDPAIDTGIDTVAGTALRQLHQVLSTVPLSVGVLDIPVGDIAAFLGRASQFSVSTVDVAVMRRLFDAVLPMCTGRSNVQCLHGDAHPGNLAHTRDGWVWMDFEETTCGPVDWDLACMAETERLDGVAALRAYGADDSSVTPFRVLRKVHAAAWLAVLAQRFPSYRERQLAGFAELRALTREART